MTGKAINLIDLITLIYSINIKTIEHYLLWEDDFFLGIPVSNSLPTTVLFTVILCVLIQYT